jgi:O-antigen/teichoic acid export membrane protein
VIGKLIGSQALGIYDRAWRTANLVTQNLVWVISDVAMPSLAALRSQPEALRAAYHRMLRFLGIVAFPALLGMFVLADELILVLYGPQWGGAVVPLRILLIFALQRAVGSPVGVVFNVVGRPDIGLKINLVMLPAYFAAIFAGTWFGIVGVALAVTLVRTVGGGAAVFLACRQIEMSFRTVVRSLLPVLGNALAMAAGVYGVKILVTRIFGYSAVAVLLIGSAFGGFLYLGILLTVAHSELEEILFAIESFSAGVGRKVRAWLRRVGINVSGGPVDVRNHRAVLEQ